MAFSVPICKNKGADQLHGNCAADQHLCFRIFKKLVFSCGDSYVNINGQKHEVLVIFQIFSYDPEELEQREKTIENLQIALRTQPMRFVYQLKKN